MGRMSKRVILYLLLFTTFFSGFNGCITPPIARADSSTFNDSFNNETIGPKTNNSGWTVSTATYGTAAIVDDPTLDNALNRSLKLTDEDYDPDDSAPIWTNGTGKHMYRVEAVDTVGNLSTGGPTIRPNDGRFNASKAACGTSAFIFEGTGIPSLKLSLLSLRWQPTGRQFPMRALVHTMVHCSLPLEPPQTIIMHLF